MINYIVAGIFDDMCLLQLPWVIEFKKEKDFNKALENIYMCVIKSDLFKQRLSSDIIISYGDVMYDMITEKKSSSKWCRVNRYYCLVFSVNFHRPYIWSEGCKKELVRWDKLRHGSQISHVDTVCINKYQQRHRTMIRNGGKDEYREEENQPEEWEEDDFLFDD